MPNFADEVRGLKFEVHCVYLRGYQDGSGLEGKALPSVCLVYN